MSAQLAQPNSSPRMPVIEVRNLDVVIRGEAASFLVVRDMDFAVATGECLAIVGESGCGKSMTALSLLRLEPAAASIDRWLRSMRRIEPRSIDAAAGSSRSSERPSWIYHNREFPHDRQRFPGRTAKAMLRTRRRRGVIADGNIEVAHLQDKEVAPRRGSREPDTGRPLILCAVEMRCSVITRLRHSCPGMLRGS